MQVTRRFWLVAAVGLTLAVGGVIADRGVLVAGSAGLSAWLLARQYRFATALGTTLDALEIDQRIAVRRVFTDEPVDVTLAATLGTDSPLAIQVTANPPVSMTGSTAAHRTCGVPPADRTATTTFTATASVAGAFTFDAPEIRVASPDGFFTETLTRGPTPTVTVDPRVPRDLQISAGGDQLAVAYGEHEAGRIGSGLEPAEVRQYVSGDAANRIDWKTTARLNQLFVREYDPETDRTTMLVIDHRAVMSVGPQGQTKLDYAREATLALVEHARELDDPFGCYTVGDEGITSIREPATGTQQFRALRETLLGLAPTTAQSGGTHSQNARAPARARRIATVLGDDTSPYGTTLAPFFRESTAYVERLEADPLFNTTRHNVTRFTGSVFTIFVTDDSRRAELREAIKLARRGDDAVLVLLTPSVLFESGRLTDLEVAYERYVEFEEFRRSLARLDRVQAYEIAPGDRLGRILTHRRQQRAPEREVLA